MKEFLCHACYLHKLENWTDHQRLAARRLPCHRRRIPVAMWQSHTCLDLCSESWQNDHLTICGNLRVRLLEAKAVYNKMLQDDICLELASLIEICDNTMRRKMQFISVLFEHFICGQFWYTHGAQTDGIYIWQSFPEHQWLCTVQCTLHK